jgi:hypothetical protein
MPSNDDIRLYAHSTQAEQDARAREIAAKALQLLKIPVVSTLLGRTEEPFAADDPMKRPDILNLINSELQPPER